MSGEKIRVSKHIKDVGSLLLASAGLFGLLTRFPEIPIQLSAGISITTAALLILSNFRVPMDRGLVRCLLNGLIFIPKNIVLWLFGNMKELELISDIDATTRSIHEKNEEGHVLLKDIHTMTLALQESVLFGRLINISNSAKEKYFIAYTHKDGHDPLVGDQENYRIAGFPFDEAEMIMRLWYFVASNLNLDWSNIRTICSCAIGTEKLKHEILSGSLAIVGSPQSNAAAELLMNAFQELESKEIFKREHQYLMKVEHGHCYIANGLWNEAGLNPTPTNPGAPDCETVMTDYAMIMKLPNILTRNEKGEIVIDRRNTVLLLAGCKVAGQFGLTQWISRPENLADLTARYTSNYFYAVLKVEYKFVPKGVPNILSIERMPCKDGHPLQGVITFT